jgi:hypothetical protein
MVARAEGEVLAVKAACPDPPSTEVVDTDVVPNWFDIALELSPMQHPLTPLIPGPLVTIASGKSVLAKVDVEERAMIVASVNLNRILSLFKRYFKTPFNLLNNPKTRVPLEILQAGLEINGCPAWVMRRDSRVTSGCLL